jgi:hypothetical protein
MHAYLWFDQWTEDDKLSKICRDVKAIPRQKNIKHKWKIST